MPAEEMYKYGSIPVPLRPPRGQQLQKWYPPRMEVDLPLPLIPREWQFSVHMEPHTVSPEYNKIGYRESRDSRVAVNDCAVFADSLSAGFQEGVFLGM